MIGLKPSPHGWRVKQISTSCSSVPTSPGVYAIGYHDTLHGLELNRVYVYVGETKNLKRRLEEHLPYTEQNPGLRAYLRRNYAVALCWYLPVDESQTKAIQDDLIRRIQPPYNTVGL